MAFLPIALGVAGAATQGIGMIAGGKSKAAAANYQAQVANNNAVIAEQNAEYAINAGLTKAGNVSMKGAATGAKIKTAQAASGLDVNTGSAVEVQASQRELDKLDAETVLHNASLDAYGYRTQATNFEAQAGLHDMEADQAEPAGYLGAAGSMLSNVSSLGFKWQSGTTT